MSCIIFKHRGTQDTEDHREGTKDACFLSASVNLCVLCVSAFRPK